MTFRDKFDTILIKCDITNAMLARICSIDASLISRFRSGKRTPKFGSNSIVKLCTGIVDCAENNGKISGLAILLDCSEKQIYITLFGMLNSNELLLSNQIGNNGQTSNISKRKPRLVNFGKKLSEIMSIFNLSNKDLSEILDIDLSLISRFKRNIRIPSKESKVIEKLSKYIVSLSLSTDQLLLLSEAMDCVSILEYMQVKSKLYSFIFDWLNESADLPDSISIEFFLDKLDLYKSNYKNLEVYKENPNDENIFPFEQTEVFVGPESLRVATLKFLTTLANTTTPESIYLYTDLPVEFLLKDDEFTKLLLQLMIKILNNNHRIIIIHNMEKKSTAIFNAINHWIALYSTGQIEPYFCRKIKNPRFTQTIFVSDSISLNSMSVTTALDKAAYNLSTRKCHTGYLKEQFLALLDNSIPLMKIINDHNLTEKISLLNSLLSDKGDLKFVFSTLSLHTMSCRLLEKILQNHGIVHEYDEIIEFFKSRKKLFKIALKKYNVYEICFSATAQNLKSNFVKIDIPFCICNKPLYYTKAEYIMHLNEIEKIREKNKNFFVKFSCSKMYQNISILYKENSSLLINKNDDSAYSLLINHPTICQSFEKFYDKISMNSIDHALIFNKSKINK